ncbi:hypothetical protein SCLCIDRAFT_115781 [Scleroderma citrinum Foug A]|uniref:Uncharacterized protein n=1 Tax=Scleroderma citrinum Foug A TaxID=1036808 RepID=A0A0C3E878_9AGAM|nr:hypothetical protein SCLCIDRAFT_115781 [Scleroderma citrinum Foug A]
MHSAAVSSCVCTSTMRSSPHCTQCAPSIPVSMRNGSNDVDPFVNAGGAPQCCHCGWRGSHSPNCPFR